MAGMRRRDVVTLIGGTILMPLSARAQQAMPVVGYLGAESPTLFATRLQAFHDGLARTGFAEGRNLTIELVGGRVAVLASPGSLAAALAAKKATNTIPIVFETGADPVVAGLVDSMRKPGGNMTGVTSLNAAVGAKRLELLHQLVPPSRTFALLVNPSNPKNAEETTADLTAAANTLGCDLKVLRASTEAEIEGAFAELERLQAGGLVIANETFFANRSGLLAALTRRYGVPAVHQSREFAAAGGLMSYGGSVIESPTQAGAYVGRILKGEKPGDLPVVQVTKVQMVINMKARRHSASMCRSR
jgi:putative ABC transport system substrate-binding protein